MPVSAMKLVNGGGGGAGGGSGGSGGGAGVGGGGEKTAFSFKKCSAFQFVKRKVSLEDTLTHFRWVDADELTPVE